MILTTVAALVILLAEYIRKGNYILAVTDVLLLMLSVGVAILSIRIFWKPKDLIS
jgi:hypothetical protein